MARNAYKEGTILENNHIIDNIYVLKVSGPFEGAPGQFYMIKSWQGTDPLLARPISIYDIDEEGNIYLLLANVGRGTDIMMKLKKGDKLYLLGPLGNKFPLPNKDEKVALVGGSVGIAPLKYLARSIQDITKNIDYYAGFRDNPYLIEDFEEYVENTYISTESGKVGYKGYIIDILESEKYDKIYTCGPFPMMKALLLKAHNRNKVLVSMESRMACGVGTCRGCSIKTKVGMRRVCKDGPIFGGGVFLIDWFKSKDSWYWI